MPKASASANRRGRVSGRNNFFANRGFIVARRARPETAFSKKGWTMPYSIEDDFDDLFGLEGSSASEGAKAASEPCGETVPFDPSEETLNESL